LILAFLFLTPREWFHDQPRIPNASQITMLPAENGSPVYWIDPVLLAKTEDKDQAAKSTELLRTRTGRKDLVVTRIQPIRDGEDEVQGYLAFARQ
jgi:hypothetical protein